MKWCIPNQGDVVLILHTLNAKADLLAAVDSALTVAPLSADLAKLRTLLRSHIDLETALARQKISRSHQEKKEQVTS